MIYNYKSGLRIRFFLALIFSILMISIDFKIESCTLIHIYLNKIKNNLSYFLYQNIINFFDHSFTNLISHRKLQKENINLNHLLLLQESELLTLNELRKENHKLRVLLNLPLINKDEKKTIVQFLSKTNDGDQIIINQGSNIGIYQGQSVMSHKGIIGQIISVKKETSKVLLVCSSENAIPITILRNNMRFIVFGDGCKKSLKLETLYNNDNIDLHIGDVLITSGLGGNFPKGYPVGMISAINIEKKSLTFKIKSFAELNNFDYLLILSKNA